MLDKHLAAKMVLGYGPKERWLDTGNYAAPMAYIICRCLRPAF